MPQYNDPNLILLLLFFPISPPGGPYGAFGGRDASRGLATFNVTSKDDFEYDDLSDLNTMEMDSVREWEMQFKGSWVWFYSIAVH